MRVELLKLSDGYWLVIWSHDQMLYASGHLKAIDALQEAQLLRVRINYSNLDLNGQYIFESA